ncbi:MAG: hypothetical protein KDK45_14025, partial [Leptospiraceae bacterium]|nr:hypothetical protein [Leptospiraceae bacterium]
QKNASAPTKVNNTTSVPKPSNQDDLDFDVGMNDDVFQPDEFSDIHLEPLEKKKEDSEGIRLDTTIVIDQLSNMPGHVSLRGKTDENGLFLGKTNSKKQMMIFAIAPNDSFAIASTGVPYSYGAEMKKFFVYTDRPVYRSGDRVFFKVLGKERKYHFEPILEGNYSYEVKRSGSSEIVQKGDFSLDEWGSFAGEIQLEKGAKPSSYYISILESTNHIGEGRFYVEQYRKPEFKVSITPSQKFYTNKEKASFRVDARYFFGSPLKNTLIRYRFYESKLRDRQAVYWWEEDYSSSESYNRLKLEGEKYLDENGRAVIEIDCGDYPYDRELSLEVTVVDKSNVAISESQAVKVGRGEFYIRIRPESNFFSTASEKKINFIVSDFSEKPVKTRLHLRFYRFIWKSWQRVYVHSESPVYETKVETDEKGRFQLSLDKELKEPGEFDIVVSAVDKKDNVIKANYTLWLYDPLHNKIESRFKNLELSLEKESLDKAGEVTVLLKSKYSGFPVLISLEGKDIYETKLIYMKDNVVPVKLQVKDGYAPNFYIQAAMQKNRALFIARESFNLPVKDTELEIKFHSKKEDFRPGETVNMELEVKSKEGKGLKADVSVSVVDEAIYSIKEDFTPRMKDFFYTKISNYVITNYSFPLNLLAGAGKDGKKDEGTRKNFKDTAHWSAHIQTDESGKAKFDFSVPDNLTEWRLTARAHDKKGRVGENRSNILVTKEIIARIGKPRFFTENDELSIIGIVNNNSQKGLENIQTGMKANGALLAKDEKPFSLPPNGSTSTYYPLKVEADKPNILLEYNALAGEFKDGLELSVPIHKVGNEFRILQTGDTKNNSNLVIPLEDSKTTQFVPEELIIQLEPGIVQSMLSSLQYLSEYPYGCTEQTISKFLPALMLDKIYKQKTGKPLSFDKDLDKKIKTGIERLKTMQNYDGSWGFWYGDSGNEFLTGYAMFSLYTASQSGYDVDQYNIKRGLAAMARMLTNPQDMEEDARAYLSFVSSLYGGADRNSIDKLIRDENSNAYRKAYLLRTLLNLQKHMKNENDKQEFKPYADKIPLILDSLKKLSEKDDKGTYFRSAEESTWSWQGGRAEVSAQVLLALLEAGDNSSLIPEILSSLQKRKEGNRWLSTRATSMVLYALSAYLEKNGIPELKEDKVEFFLNNKKIASFDLHPKETVGLKTVIPLSEFKDKQILLRANSQNQLNSFFSIEIKGNLYFKKEEEKKELEKGLSLERKLYTVKRVLDINRQEYLVPELFDTKKPLKTGDELMLKLRFKADRNYEFLALEAFLPSGFEVVKEDAYESSGVYSHKEKWDDKMVYFFSKVTKDEIYEVAYIIRAELPGKIQMKAAHIECMYSPDIRAWSDLKQLIIQEK